MILILLQSGVLLRLPYKWHDPFHVKEDDLKNGKYDDLEVGDPTNKTIVFTIVFHCVVLMQIASLIWAKTLDEEAMTWREKFVK